MHTVDFQALANVVMPAATGRAFAAKDLRLHRHPIARPEVLYVAPRLDNNASAFVSLHDGKTHVFVPAVINLNIGTANANPLHLD